MAIKDLQKTTSERNWRLAREAREERGGQGASPSVREPAGGAGRSMPVDIDYAVYFLDAEGRIRGCSSGAQRFKGYAPHELIGMHFSVLYTQADQHAVRPAQALRIALEEGRFAEEIWREHKDGRRFWAYVIIDLITDQDDKPIGYAKVTHDLTERRETEQRLRDLHTANRELEQFIHIASHDLREPLRKMQAFNDLLVNEEGDKLSSDGRTYLEHMMGATRRMQELLNSLLILTRVTSQGKPFTTVDLNRILDDVCNDLAVLIEEAGAEVRVQPLDRLDADGAQLRMLFQNLISNAIKYARPEVAPVVDIHMAEDQSDDWCRLMVEDNGIGFEAQYGEKIFGVFQRLHGRDKYAGAGVGLSICRKICERHGGEISAEPRPEGGARFVIALPARHVITHTADPAD